MTFNLCELGSIFLLNSGYIWDLPLYTSILVFSFYFQFSLLNPQFCSLKSKSSYTVNSDNKQQSWYSLFFFFFLVNLGENFIYSNQSKCSEDSHVQRHLLADLFVFALGCRFQMVEQMMNPTVWGLKGNRTEMVFIVKETDVFAFVDFWYFNLTQFDIWM